MVPACCWCNTSGRCKNCACRKANRERSDCLPCRLGHCENQPVSAYGRRAHRTARGTNESIKVTNASLEIVTQSSDTALRETQAPLASISDVSASMPMPEPDEHAIETQPPPPPIIFSLLWSYVLLGWSGRWDVQVCLKSNLRQSTGEEISLKSPQEKLEVHLFVNSLACLELMLITQLSRAWRHTESRDSYASPALQQPYPRSKAKDHVLHWESRLQLWGSERLKDLEDEGLTI